MCIDNTYYCTLITRLMCSEMFWREIAKSLVRSLLKEVGYLSHSIRSATFECTTMTMPKRHVAIISASVAQVPLEFIVHDLDNR